MSTIDTTTAGGSTSRQPTPVKVTVYHNDEARFMPYEDGHQLTAVTTHWLGTPAGDPIAIADWVFRAFNADLYRLESQRHQPGGETAFLAACVYRLLHHRSLSVGDVIQVDTGQASVWLACEPVGWRMIAEPANRSGQALSAARVYQHLVDQRTTGSGVSRSGRATSPCNEHPDRAGEPS